MITFYFYLLRRRFIIDLMEAVAGAQCE
jgi:hypothetical protein